MVRLKNGESGETSEPKSVEIADNGKIPFRQVIKAFPGKTVIPKPKVCPHAPSLPAIFPEIPKVPVGNGVPKSTEYYRELP